MLAFTALGAAYMKAVLRGQGGNVFRNDPGEFSKVGVMGLVHEPTAGSVSEHSSEHIT
jgi:hypothetical protein